MTTRHTRRAFLGSTVGLAAGLAGCLSGQPGGDAPPTEETATTTEMATGTERMESGPTPTEATDTETPTETMATATESSSGGWRTRALTDALTDETFAIAEFETPVVLEFFAVWCPICTSQQRELATLREELGDGVTIVSLNIDPNEDAGIIRRHAAEHGFDWRYAIAPTTMTWALTDEFGSSITSAPAAPVVVLCPGGEATFFSRGGVKRADVLRSQVEAC